MKYFFVILLILLGCEQVKKEQTFPIIPEDKFILLLVDFHLAQGVASTNTFVQKTNKVQKFSVVDSILVKYGYNKAIFDSTISYYSGEPDKMEEIYEKVITILSRMLAEVQEKIAKSQGNAIQDTISIKTKRGIPTKKVETIDKRFNEMREIFNNAKHLKK